MATSDTATWRLRTGGNAANGAGYDAGISGAGTDYTQQDSAQLTLSDIACSNNTTVTSATGGFTSAMIGNAIKISGGGATTGHYWITARASTNSITVDRTPGTVTNGAGRVGGASRLPSDIGSHVAAGNTVYLLGSAGNAASYPTGSFDYTESSFFTPTAGTTTDGFVKWIKDPNGPTPTLGANGLYIYNVGFQWFEELYFSCTSNSNGSSGVILGSNVVMRGCIVSTANRASMAGVSIDGGVIQGCEFYGGTTSPSSSSGASLIKSGNYSTLIIGNVIRYSRDHGISGALTGAVVRGNKIYGCVTDGINHSGVDSTIVGNFSNNTINDNDGHGIAVTGTAGICNLNIYNNNISNHTQSGKAGISISQGSTAKNDRRKRIIDYNNLYNNTANYASVSAGAHDLSVDPAYADAANGDFEPGEATLFGAALGGGWIGAEQPASGGGGGGTTYFIPVE